MTDRQIPQGCPDAHCWWDGTVTPLGLTLGYHKIGEPGLCPFCLALMIPQPTNDSEWVDDVGWVVRDGV